MTQPSGSRSKLETNSVAEGVIRKLDKHEDKQKFFRCELCNIRQHLTPNKYDEHMKSAEHVNMKLLHDYGMWPGQGGYVNDKELKANQLVVDQKKVMNSMQKAEKYKNAIRLANIRDNYNGVQKKLDILAEGLRQESRAQALPLFPYKFMGLNDGRVYCAACMLLFADATKLLLHQMTLEHSVQRTWFGTSDDYKTLYYCELCRAFIGHSRIPFDAHLRTDYHLTNVKSQEILDKFLSSKKRPSRDPLVNSSVQVSMQTSNQECTDATSKPNELPLPVGSVEIETLMYLSHKERYRAREEKREQNRLENLMIVDNPEVPKTNPLNIVQSKSPSLINTIRLSVVNKPRSNLVDVQSIAARSSSSGAIVQSQSLPPGTLPVQAKKAERKRPAKFQQPRTGFPMNTDFMNASVLASTSDELYSTSSALPPSAFPATRKELYPGVPDYSVPPPSSLPVASDPYSTSASSPFSLPSALPTEQLRSRSRADSVCNPASSLIPSPSSSDRRTESTTSPSSSVTLPAAFTQPGMKDLLAQLVATNTVSLQATLLSQLIEEKRKGQEKQQQFEAQMKKLTQLYADETAPWVWEGIDPNLKPAGSIVLDLDQYYLQLEYQLNNRMAIKSRVCDTAITKYKGNLAMVAQMEGASTLLIEALPSATDPELKQLIDELNPAIVAVAVSPQGSRLLCELLTHYAVTQEDRYRLVRSLAEALTPDAVAELLSQADKVRILDSAFRVGVENRYRLARLVIPTLFKVDDKLGDDAVKTTNTLRRSAAFMRYMLQVIGVADLKPQIAPLLNTADAVHELCDRVLGRVLIDAVLESAEHELHALVYQRVLMPLNGDIFLQFATKNRDIGLFVQACVRRCDVKTVGAFAEYVMAGNCRLLVALMSHSSGNYIVRALWFAADHLLKQTIALRLRPQIQQLLTGKFSRHMASTISQFDTQANCAGLM